MLIERSKSEEQFLNSTFTFQCNEHCQVRKTVQTGNKGHVVNCGLGEFKFHLLLQNPWRGQLWYIRCQQKVKLKITHSGNNSDGLALSKKK